MNTIGLDVGGTKIEGVLVDTSMKEIRRIHKATPASSQEILSAIAAAIAELDDGTVAAAGIGLAGYEEYWGHPNLPSLRGIDVQKELEKLTGKKIILANDAQCFALAEQKLGAAKNAKDVVALTLGTGVGGGAIVNGQLMQGKRDAAGHFGHMIIDPSGIPCACGQKGDVEAWCGGKNMEKRYTILTGKQMTGRELFASDDTAAKKIIDEMHEKLAIAVSNLAKAFNPECIVLGGSISGDVDYEKLNRLAVAHGLPGISKDAKIVKNALGPTSGVLGAALLAHSSSSSSAL
jgi:fructokinase